MGRILDIGCGTGDFLYNVKIKIGTQKGRPSEIIRTQAIENYNLNVIESTDLREIKWGV